MRALMNAADWIENTLARIEREGELRALRARAGAGGVILHEGRGLLNFSSNDYLNLAHDPRLKQGATRAIEQYGCGATASRLMSGNLPLHEELETRLAALCRQESALLFGSGYLANLGLLAAIAGRDDAIYADRLCHASLIDGARLSGAELIRFNHNDADHLESLLRRRPSAGRGIVVTESVFSMDGDCATLNELHEVASRHECALVLDEAHAIGVFGKDGGGCAADSVHRPDFIIGTLGKALGGYGGFVACSRKGRDLLINRARGFIFSTAPPPPCLGAALAALDALRQNAGLGAELLSRAARFREDLQRAGLAPSVSRSQIAPVIIGGNHEALSLAAHLESRDILAVAVRPPTVPPGTARLRMSVTLAHDHESLRSAADAVASAMCALGISKTGTNA